MPAPNESGGLHRNSRRRNKTFNVNGDEREMGERWGRIEERWGRIEERLKRWERIEERWKRLEERLERDGERWECHGGEMVVK